MASRWATSAAAPARRPPTRAAHFSCSMTAVLLARVQDFGGDDAVTDLLARAGSQRTVPELLDIVNWISYDEAVALWRAGALVTHHPQFARAVGEDSARRLSGSPVAALLRSLGSPEDVYRQIATAASKYSTVASFEAVRWGAGFAEIVAVAAEGFPRDANHCASTCGLLTQTPVLFGLPPATVEHERCQAFGADACEYRITWAPEPVPHPGGMSARIHHLTEQLEAMKERQQSMFQTAADLIGAGEIEHVLARIADRAAIEVRAPRYLLAVRMSPDAEFHYHRKGFDDREVAEYTDALMHQDPSQLPPSWLVVPVRSNRSDYGRLLAMYDEGVQFFPQERELLEVYARYAASALDSASALHEAEQRYGQSSALLELARALASAGTSAEVARRLADSVPVVVDCDRVGVYLWDAARDELVREAVAQVGDGVPASEGDRAAWPPTPGGLLAELLLDPRPDPIFFDHQTGDPAVGKWFTAAGFAATIMVPLASPSRFLGLLAVSVTTTPERLRPSDDLLDRLSGVAAQATTALQNGRLMDEITHQALHDQLTGLANRVQFTTALRSAVHVARERSELVTVFYLDLDRFKPVNDEYGHEVGDALLAAVGQRLIACTRARDVVARLGGDEFAVLLTAQDTVDLNRMARRIREAFAQSFSIDGHALRLGVSVGRSIYPLDAGDADSLLRLADAAMFEAKRSRRMALADPGARSGTPA